MKSKRGIELSFNFIVMLIISIVIFGFGVVFISRLSSQATELQELTVSELDDRIGSLVCEGSDRVCISIDRKTIKRTEFDVFGLKIINVLEDQKFDIKVMSSSLIGYKRDKDKTPIGADSPKLIINPAARDLSIKKNEEKNIGIGIQVPSNAVSGTYILNVEIRGQSESGDLYVPVQKLYVDVP